MIASTSSFSPIHCSRTRRSSSCRARSGGGLVGEVFSLPVERRLPLVRRVPGFLFFAFQLDPAGLSRRLQLGELTAFFGDRSADLLPIVLEEALRFGESAFGVVHPHLLGELGPNLFDRHPHFERIAVRLFQLDPQAVEPLTAAFKTLAVGRQRLFATVQLALAGFAFLFPIAPIVCEGV